MRVFRPSIVSGAESCRLSTRVSFDKTGEERTYWFEVPAAFGSFLDDSGDPWLCLFAPLALALGEDLQIDAAVDPLLLRNMRAAINQWHQWYPRFRHVPRIEAEVRPTPIARSAASAAFYSGGLDSLFTLLRNNGTPDWAEGGTCNLDYLLLVWGFDIPLSDQLQFERTRTELERAATSFGRKLIVVKTNLKSFTDEMEVWWVELTHASALAFVSHCLSKGFGTALVASSFTYGALFPWGSHPLTDPLHTSTKMAVQHDGAGHTRVEKTAYVARSQEAMRVLRVCGKSNPPGVLNCSKCQKCLRTMTSLDIFGCTGDKAPSFDWSEYAPERFGGIFLKTIGGLTFAEEIRDAAVANARPDIAAAAARALARSRAFKLLATVEYSLRRRFPGLLKHREQLIVVQRAAYRIAGLSR